MEFGEVPITEAGGGILIGLVAGYVGYRALAGMDEYTLEVLVTLAVVMGGYALCNYLTLSGPLAMAVAGLLIGNHGVTYAMSDVTRDYLVKFWELVDELLNSVLFLLIGLEMIVLVAGFDELVLALAAIPLTLAARGVGIFVSTKAIPAARLQDKGAGRVLWWGGLRGGISIALALSLPAGETRDLILAATFAAVLFSVLVQRATLGRLKKEFPSAYITVLTPESNRKSLEQDPKLDTVIPMPTNGRMNLSNCGSDLRHKLRLKKFDLAVSLYNVEHGMGYSNIDLLAWSTKPGEIRGYNSKGAYILLSGNSIFQKIVREKTSSMWVVLNAFATVLLFTCITVGISAEALFRKIFQRKNLNQFID